jgi:hypothetical protein
MVAVYFTAEQRKAIRLARVSYLKARKEERRLIWEIDGGHYMDVGDIEIWVYPWENRRTIARAYFESRN